MEKLSEQLALADLVAWTSAGSLTSSTGDAIDMKNFHRAVVLLVGSVSATGTGTAAGTGTDTVATAVATADLTWSVKIQASTSTGFGTPTTITTVTGSDSHTATATTTSSGGTGTTTTATCTADLGGEIEIHAGQVQAARAAEDRYVRAVVSLGSSDTPNIALASVYGDSSRYKPAVEVAS